MTVSKDSCTIVGDGSTEAEVAARVKQIKRMIEDTEQVMRAAKKSYHGGPGEMPGVWPESLMGQGRGF